MLKSLRLVRFNFAVKQRNQRLILIANCSNSNDKFRQTMNDMKKRMDKDKVDTDTKNSDNSEKKTAETNNINQQLFSSINQITSIIKPAADLIIENVREAYKDLTGENKRSSIRKKVHQAESYRPPPKSDDDDVEAPAYEGPAALVVVKGNKSAWEQMKDRLQDSPLIREFMQHSKKVSKAAAETDIGKKAQDIGKSVKEKIEDAREFWETSQNPLVYTLSGVWDNIVSETDEGLAVTAIRKLDPQFDKEEWAAEVKESVVPLVVKAHLAGDTKALKPWLGEAAYSKLAADIRQRKQDGVVIDSNILDIDQNQVIVRLSESGSPAIVVVYMIQQINCIRNRKGEIVEGSEVDIKAKFYYIAFQQAYVEETEEVEWKIVDYQFAGDIPYY